MSFLQGTESYKRETCVYLQGIDVIRKKQEFTCREQTLFKKTGVYLQGAESYRKFTCREHEVERVEVNLALIILDFFCTAYS